MSISIPKKVLYIVRSGEGYSAVGHLPCAVQQYVQKTSRLLRGNLDNEPSQRSLSDALDNDERNLRFDRGTCSREEVRIPKIVLCYGPGNAVRETAEIILEELKPRPLHFRQLLHLDAKEMCVISKELDDLGVIVGNEEQIGEYLRTAKRPLPPSGSYIRVPLVQGNIARYPLSASQAGVV